MDLYDLLYAIQDTEAGIDDGDPYLAADGLDQLRELIADAGLMDELGPALDGAVERVEALFAA